MGAISNALRFAKAVGPQIVASPLHAPRIISRYFSGQALAALAELIEVDDGPQYTTLAPKPGYSTMEPKVEYSTMAKRPSVEYSTMAKNGPLEYGIMSKKPPVEYGVLSRKPGVDYSTMQPRFGHAMPAAAPPMAHNLGSSIALPGMANIPLLSMPDHHRHNDQMNNVKYVSDPGVRFDKYAVVIHQTITRRGTALDTGEVKNHFVRKGAQIGIACFGHDANDHQARFTKLANEWGYQGLIWVCVKDGHTGEPVFFSHVGKTNRFHHSSFTGGGDVIAAGEWIIKRGRLLKISANSGHYRPPLDYFHRAVLLMSKAWNNDTTVMLWNVKKDTYEDVPVRVFAKTPSGGNLWKTSPKA